MGRRDESDPLNFDADVKDGAGGLESYAIIRDTFDLPETLTAATQSSGGHFVFDLPDDLPAEWLKSWTRIGDEVALGGIDLKVGVCGLMYAEPTRGKHGVYRWVDPAFPVATLPRACCDFLHELRYGNDEPKTEKPRQSSRVYSSSNAPRAFDPDQAKFFRDVSRGERHKRLLKIARAIRAVGGDADQIRNALNYHASRFSEPLDDQPWIDRVAGECELKFAPEVSR